MKQIIIVLTAIVLIACQAEKKPSVDELFKVDLEFSSAAGKIGYNKAFIEFAHNDAVLLRKNSMPVVGKSSIAALFEKADTTGIDFSWKPLAGDIAVSGELGYTYGTYTLKADTVVEQGTYISVWKKDTSGQWKYVLDSGNEGLGK